MRVMVRVVFPDRTVRDWWLSTDSYRMPVLADQANNVHYPAELPPGTVIRVQSRHLLFAEGARLAGYTVEN